MQADPNKKNMERMEERVADADEQQLQQMLTDSPWEHQAVIDQVALEANQWLGGHRNSCLLIDESVTVYSPHPLRPRWAHQILARQS